MTYLVNSAYTHYNFLDYTKMAGAANGAADINGNSVVGGNNTFSPNGAGASANSGVNPGNANSNDVVAPDKEDYKAQFETKLGLINKYCSDYIVLDENGNEIDVNQIRKDYANKYEEGVKYCDKLINSFDKDKVEKIVKSEYKKRVDANAKAGEAIANEWVKQLLEAGTTAAKINTSNVNANNILEVTGAFVNNEDVKDGKVSLAQLFEDPTTAENLTSAMKTKAQSFIKRKDIDETVKNTVIEQVNLLVDAKYDYINASTEEVGTKRDKLVDAYMAVFETVRVEQAKLNDAAAPQYYGVPENFNMTVTNESDRAKEEVESYKKSRSLNLNS